MEGFHILFEERMEKLKLFYSRGVYEISCAKSGKEQSKKNFRDQLAEPTAQQSFALRDQIQNESAQFSFGERDQLAEPTAQQSFALRDLGQQDMLNEHSFEPSIYVEGSEITYDFSNVSLQGRHIEGRHIETVCHNGSFSMLEAENYKSENEKENENEMKIKTKRKSHKSKDQCRGIINTTNPRKKNPQNQTNFEAENELKRQKQIFTPDASNPSVGHIINDCKNDDLSIGDLPSVAPFPKGKQDHAPEVDSFEKQAISNVFGKAEMEHNSNQNLRQKSKSKPEKIVKLRECKELYRLLNRKRY